ncbi:MAG: hypothetical protein ABSE63_09025 [Thermoguttaceae bacterium]|jgi:hypothetical protein
MNENETELLAQLREERQMMMGHWRDAENGMGSHVIALIGSIGGFAYFYFKGEWGPFALPREWILFAFVEFAFMAFLSLVSLWCGVCTYGGYIRALEDRINGLTEEPTAVWVGGVWRRFTATPHGAFFWCWVVIDILAVTALIGILVAFLVSPSPVWMRILTALEIPTAVMMLIWARLDLDRSESFARSLLSGRTNAKKR